MSRRRWKSYGEDWPEGTRVCTKCERNLPFSDFHRHKGCLRGFNSVCKSCRRPISKKQWRNIPRITKILQRAKSRATKLGREFSITDKDIEIPEECPVFKVPFSFELNSDLTPSIDRIDSNKGYVPGNVIIMSKRANLLKNNGTVEEFEMILDFLKRYEI